MSTGSERFSLLICLDVTKFVLLSVFTLIETICPKICSKSRLKGAKKNNFRLTSVAPRSCCLSSLLGTGQREVSRKHSEGWQFTIIRTNLSESRLLGSSLIPYIPLTFPESRTVFWWNPSNLVPRAFPLKNGWGTAHFLREKPWGRGWNPGSSEYPFRTGMKITPLRQALSNFEKEIYRLDLGVSLY